MISTGLLAIVRCPECRAALRVGAARSICSACGREYGGTDAAFLDLRPATTFREKTRYLDAALHGDARHETVSPPLLSAALRNDVLREFMALGPDDRVVDLGCGSGRVLVWNRDARARMVGIDVSPFFASEALQSVDLALGDLRRLPFADGAFTKAYCLDVLEHLSRESLGQVLTEAARVLAPGGRLFVYSHVRRNSSFALGLRGINKLAHGLARIGLVDLTREHLRKSDHLNPLADIPDLERAAGEAGLRVTRIRYYTPLVGAFIENILVRVAERAMTRRAERRIVRAHAAAGTAHGGGPSSASPAPDLDPSSLAARVARTEAKRRLARRGPAYATLRILTALMKVDLWLFGRIRSGPFFALLVKG
ncbi:MAG: methyltransferase domain-containing protein [Acidobacteria bacterium]|nr:methyltransferase domain-containing protein [Acidobacteriota bacterium]